MPKVTYDDKFSGDVLKSWGEIQKENTVVSTYAVEIEDGFNTPPVAMMFKFISEPYDFDLQDQIAHACIKGKLVAITLDGVAIGPGFQINAMTDSWDSVQFFKEHPMAFSILINNCSAFVLKKYKPLVKNTVSPGLAGAKPISSA